MPLTITPLEGKVVQKESKRPKVNPIVLRQPIRHPSSHLLRYTWRLKRSNV